MRARIISSVAVLAALSCTNQKLVPVTAPAPQNVDDLLEIDANFCTRPEGNVDFPVKLLLVVDASGSMQFTDQPGLRVNAVLQLMNTLATQQNVFVSTMAFGSNIYQQPQVSGPKDQIFQPASQWTEPSFLTLKDVTTDYQGTLAAIQQTLLLDMLQQDAATLARTKYVVVFFSDGAPNPKCCTVADAQIDQIVDPFGCAPAAWQSQQVANPDGTIYCEGFPENVVCFQNSSLDNFRQNVQTVVGGSGQPNYGNGVLNALNGLTVDANYNRVFQIEQGMRDIVKLGQTFGVGDLQFNTALLGDPSLDNSGVGGIIQLNSCDEAALLQDMATIGNGQFRDFTSSQEIDFLSFDFTSLKQGFTLIDAYAVNKNALPPGGDPSVVDYRPDSDGDGLDDDTEFAIGTDASSKDSDKQVAPPVAGQAPVILTDPKTWGDGFDDNFEVQRENIGFDPRFQSLPVKTCPFRDVQTQIDQQDLDGDGLNGCEEAILGTDPFLADTDGDSLPDGLEVRLGLDPLIAEGNRDDDFDGTPNLEEVRKGRDPHVPDSNREQTSVRYELVETGHTEDGRTCYTSIARGIHLATTQPRFVGGRRGYNDIFYFLAEAPQDNATNRVDFRMACARVQYIKPTFKDPLQGKVTLQESDFLDLDDPDVIANLNDPTFDPCIGLGVQ